MRTILPSLAVGVGNTTRVAYTTPIQLWLYGVHNNHNQDHKQTDTEQNPSKFCSKLLYPRASPSNFCSRRAKLGLKFHFRQSFLSNFRLQRAKLAVYLCAEPTTRRIQSNIRSHNRVVVEYVPSVVWSITTGHHFAFVSGSLTQGACLEPESSPAT